MATGVLQSIDRQIDVFFSGWNVASTVLAVVSIIVLFYPVFFGAQADVHPFILARQAHASPVRKPGESAIYRAPETPNGFPLRSGLNVKDEGAPAWAPGKDGDLRHVWREATKSKNGQTARVLSIKGKDKPVQHELSEITATINIIGSHIKKQSGTRVAVCLPNSVELLITILAAAFSGFTVILIPHPHGQADELLGREIIETNADVLIASAGTVPQRYPLLTRLKHTVWVVEQTSRQLGWKDSDAAHSSEWHKIIDDAKSTASQSVPTIDSNVQPPSVLSLWQREDPEDYEAVEFSQKNISAAVAAQLYALPPSHRLEARDLVLSLEPMTRTFPLCISLAAIFAGATIALTSVAGAAPDYSLAFQNVQPTVVIASAETAAHAHARHRDANKGFFQSLDRSRQARNLAAGAMPRANSLARNSGRPGAGPRLLYVSERAGADSVPLSAPELADLRIWTGARVIYALTAARVAGAVAQTNMMDYRVDEGATGARSHFGPPLSCVELKIVEDRQHKIPDEGEGEHIGNIDVSGPAVVGGRTRLGISGTFGVDNTLVLR